MSEASWTTPKMIEEKERQAKQKEAEKIKLSIEKNGEPNKNLKSFLKGYNLELDNYFNSMEQSEKKKEEIKKLLNDDMVTQTLADERIRDLNKVIEDLKYQATENLINLGNQFKSAYTEQATPSGERLNNNDIKLLQSGIELSQSELQALADKHNADNNQTMLRILKEYAGKRDMFITFKGLDQYVESIDDLINSTKKGLNNNEYWETYIKTPEHRKTLLNNFKEMI